MKLLITKTIFLLALFTAETPHLLAQPTKPLPPQPDDFTFTGHWSCEGALRAGKVHRSKFTGATILGGKWLELSEEDLEPATGYNARYLIGYDPQQHRLVEFDANNFGAAVYSSGSGWQDHVLTMTAALDLDPQGNYALNRFVYTTSGKDSFTVDWQVSSSHTKPVWNTADHLLCKRN